MKIDIDKDSKFVELFKQLQYGLNNRYYIYYGGRGSGKSWQVAIFIYLIMRKQNYRILCTREFQKNIKDSSKKLIEDAIKRHGLEHEFDMLRDMTRHKKTGSEILYYGLHHNTAEIKSLEGVDICWCEESENTSQESLDLLIPTIRKEKSIIIFTINPDKKENPVYKTFIDSQEYEGLIKRKVNYYNNKYFTNVLKKEMERCRERDPEKYDWVWEGNCREYSEAQILKGCYSIKDFELPEDTVYLFGADWGFSQDPNTLIRASLDDKTLYIDYAIFKQGVEIDHTPQFFNQIPKSKQFKIIADNARPELISYMKRQGYNIYSAKKGKDSIKEGIEYLRSLDIVIHPRCKELIEEFKLYSYKVDKVTGQILPEIVDKYNHGIDGLRYLSEALRPNQKGRRTIVR